MTETDVGGACLTNDDFGGVEANVSGVVHVNFNAVGCWSYESGSCRADLDGDHVEVSATLVTKYFGGGTCTPATAPEVTCTAPALSTGAYRLGYGRDSTAFEVPSTGRVCTGVLDGFTWFDRSMDTGTPADTALIGHSG